LVKSIRKMTERLAPRGCKPLDWIIRAAARGHAIGVDNAVLNGDMDSYPESYQRIVVAAAHDNVVGTIVYRSEPMNEERKEIYDNLAIRNFTFAVKVFFKTDGKSLKEEISEFRLR
jgi:elongation factor P hydroxylase